MAIRIRNKFQLYEGTEAELIESRIVFKTTDEIWTTDTKKRFIGDGENTLDNLSPIDEDGSGGSVTWSTIPGKPAVVASGANQAAARTSIGLGSASTQASTSFATSAQGSLAETALQDVSPGANISIDKTDPKKPVISATGELAGTEWGQITGTLSDQVDLAGAFAGKADTSALSDYVPTTRTVNGNALSDNVTLSAADVSAVPTSRTVNNKALSANISLTNTDVDAAATVHTHIATDITDTTEVGRSVMTATDAAAARTAIGAGTSNLAIGTSSSTAKAGDYQPSWSDVTSKPTVIASGTTQENARNAIGLGTAATSDSTDFATAAQGAKADTATQPADIANRVVGPSSAANNNVPVFDGTTGKLLADSGIVLTALVRTSDDQTVGGVKTFSSIPVLPGSDPTTSNQAVRKAYADSLVAAKSNKVVEIVGASDASLTYGLTHAGLDKIVRTTGGGNKTHTIPLQATVAWPDGSVIQLATPSSEVTIEGASGVNLIADQEAPWVIAPNTVATIIRLGNNEWILAAKFKEEV